MMIIPELHRRQHERGYLTKEDLHRVANDTRVPLHRVQSVVSFFPHFRTTPPPAVTVHLCRDMSCHLRGSEAMIEEVRQRCAEQHGSQVEVCGVSCLGRCDRAPAAIINEQLFVSRSAEEICGVVDAMARGETPPADTDAANPGAASASWEIEIYDSPSDYRTVRKYLTDPDPAAVLKALETAGLLGMGGAGGRAYLKWGDVQAATGTAKYVVCNADESEPGTFKDREILLRLPHLIVEGMILGGLVTGAERGWVYIRHEYPEQIAAVREEIERARRVGAIGKSVFGSQFRFELEVYISPGGYICGEQTALIEAMEDKRAEPRNRPPELMTNGYLNQPTLLSNVETFAWVPAILDRDAGRWYAAEGRKEGTLVAGQSQSMRGRRLFSISGDVHRPGVYEVPTGIPLGELIEAHAGGIRGGRALAAVALSGPSGGLLPAKIPVTELSRRFVESYVPAGSTHLDVLDLPLDIQVSRAIGYMLGAGIVVYAEGADLLAEALACSRFFRNESCGKCVPCRIGSEKITALGSRLQAGEISPDALPMVGRTIKELGDVMETTSICGLGQVASNPLRSFLRYFPDLAADACQPRVRPLPQSTAQDRSR